MPKALCELGLLVSNGFKGKNKKKKRERKAGGKETLLADPKEKCNFFFTKPLSLWLGYCSKHRKAGFLQLTTLKLLSLMHE